MDAILPELIKQGSLFLILAAIGLAIYRGSREVWKTVKSWGGTLLEHWIASGKRRDEMMGQISALLAENARASEERFGRAELAAEQRHAAALAQSVELAKENRHALRNLLTPILANAEIMNEDTPPDPSTR